VDGRHWTTFSRKPDPAIALDMSGVSAKDGWFVAGPVGASIEHWDGQRWSRIAVPGMGTATLNGSAAVSHNEAWAVGDPGAAGGQRARTPLVMHWNGKDWSVVPTDALSGQGQLASVSAPSAGAAWAAGDNWRFGHRVGFVARDSCRG